PEELELLDDYEKPLILKPWEKKSVFWRVQIPKELNNNYVYTFPAILTTQRNQTIKADFSSESGWTQLNLDMLDEIIEENDIGKGTDALSFFCITEKNEVKLNEKMIFTCKLANNQRMVLSGLNVCLENDCKLTSLNPGEEKELFFEKSFDKESGNIVVITAKNDEISKAYYTSIMVLDTPKLKIENMNFPKFVNYNDEFAVNFTIFKSSYSPPKNVVLTLHQNKNIESWQIENMDGSLPFAINLEGRYLKLGRNEMEVLLNYEDADGNKYVSEETFTVYLQTKSFWEKVMIYINQAALFLERIIFY
ncbi:hypothetical protein GOV08_02750, partial [Candidatus Woesearchaeota archaeon]|nr:hypothetical protein [Candidatus Woesearchaeota archaeon]